MKVVASCHKYPKADSEKIGEHENSPITYNYTLRLDVNVLNNYYSNGTVNLFGKH